MQAAIYCRISEDRRDDAGESAGDREHVRQKGWEVAGAYVDNDVSAFRGKARPAYPL